MSLKAENNKKHLLNTQLHIIPFLSLLLLLDIPFMKNIYLFIKKNNKIKKSVQYGSRHNEMR